MSPSSTTFLAHWRLVAKVSFPSTASRTATAGTASRARAVKATVLEPAFSQRATSTSRRTSPACSPSTGMPFMRTATAQPSDSTRRRAWRGAACRLKVRLNAALWPARRSPSRQIHWGESAANITQPKPHRLRPNHREIARMSDANARAQLGNPVRLPSQSPPKNRGSRPVWYSAIISIVHATVICRTIPAKIERVFIATIPSATPANTAAVVSK